MKILKSSFHFQPSDDLFPIDKFRQITEFIKITANLKRRFVMVTTPDILTALSLVMRLEPIGNLLWQGRIESNQFQIIPDIFHPMDKPGYILIRYVDADTVTLIEFEEHMMGVAGFDSIVGKTEETESETKQETDEDFQRYLCDRPPLDEQAKDPRYFQLAKQVGDKYVFDPEICRPSTETCGECIHEVCCEKAKIAKRAARKDKQSDKRQLKPANGQPAESDDIPAWKMPIDRIEKLLDNCRIEYNREDNGSCHYLRYENGDKEYCVYFENRDDVLPGSYYAVFSVKRYGEGGKGLWEGLINSYNSLYELQQAIVDKIEKT